MTKVHKTCIILKWLEDWLSRCSSLESQHCSGKGSGGSLVDDSILRVVTCNTIFVVFTIKYSVKFSVTISNIGFCDLRLKSNVVDGHSVVELGVQVDFGVRYEIWSSNSGSVSGKLSEKSVEIHDENIKIIKIVASILSISASELFLEVETFWIVDDFQIKSIWYTAYRFANLLM